MALLAACGSANPNSMTFVGNAQTVERVFRAFEVEDSTAFWAEFAETAVWRGTGVNAPTTLSREKMGEVYEEVLGRVRLRDCGRPPLFAWRQP